MNTEWNLKLVLEKDDDATLKKLRAEERKKADEFITRWKENKSYLEEPQALKEALDQYEKFVADYYREDYYFGLKRSLDQSNHEIKAKCNSAEEFGKKIANDLRFFELSLAKISPEKQKEMLAYPGLLTYKHYLERLFAVARHLLSEKEENIMTLKSTTSYSNWVNMVEDFLSREEKEVMTESGKREKKTYDALVNLMKSQNKKVRDEGAVAFSEIMDKYVDVAENELNSILANKKVDDELRKFERADSARHIEDDVKTEVVDALIASVKGRFSIAHRYYMLKARLIGAKKLKYHERSVQVGEIKEKYSYEKAVELVRNVFGNLDNEFVSIFDSYNKNGQVDAFPHKGKQGGAFCTCAGVKAPTYLLLNHEGTLHDVETMAHETGHGINNELMRKKQNSLNFGTPKSTAEVASTFMEDFVLDELLKETNDEERLAILLEKLDNDMSTIFRQAALYMFEQELHIKFREKGYLSKKEIGELFAKHMQSYFGEVMDMNGYENWWVYWSHIRMFFYVYSYVSGLLISKSLQNAARKDKKFIAKVKEFLASGTSDSPENIFKRMGIDINRKEFWNQGLDEVEKLLEEAEKLAKKLKKI